MKKLYTVKTIRELKRIVSNLSKEISTSSRKFSKRFGIYCSWSRMTKAQLIKIIDYFGSQFSIKTVMKAFFGSDFVKPFWLVKQSLKVLQHSLSHHAFSLVSIQEASLEDSPILNQKGRYCSYGNCSIFVPYNGNREFYLEFIGFNGLHLLLKFRKPWSSLIKIK